MHTSWKFPWINGLLAMMMEKDGVLTTNLSESFNGVLKKARGLLVTAMIRLSLEQTIERYTRRSQIAHQLAEQNELWTGRFKIKWE